MINSSNQYLSPIKKAETFADSAFANSSQFVYISFFTIVASLPKISVAPNPNLHHPHLNLLYISLIPPAQGWFGGMLPSLPVPLEQ